MMWSGVLKSGSPCVRATMSTPAARNSRTRCVAAAEAVSRARATRADRNDMAFLPRLVSLLVIYPIHSANPSSDTRKPNMTDTPQYTPPEVWVWEKGDSPNWRYGHTNRPVAG